MDEPGGHRGKRNKPTRKDKSERSSRVGSKAVKLTDAGSGAVRLGHGKCGVSVQRDKPPAARCMSSRDGCAVKNTVS